MSSRRHDPLRPQDDSLWFLPLGGSGEIGMNLNLYGTAGKWLMVDCGISFPDETMPGIEVIMPDISFISERRDDLVGLVVTHGHEDHLGAIEYLWPQLQCPVYATPFAAGLIRSKLGRKDKKSGARIIEIPIGGAFEIGPFQVDMLPVTHSIPESHMLAIGTRFGKVLHTGDWKFDSHPVVGGKTDFDALKALGDEGLLALVGDSTNALVAGHAPSEIEAQKALKDVFSRFKNRIVVTCFASNVARIKSIAAAAHAHGRQVALVGRSLWRNAEIAESCGYLPEFKTFLEDDEAMDLPRNKVVMVATGCQGEVNAALSRIAVGSHPAVELEEDDVVIFSSREIPGNEKAIGRVQNLLLESGVEILTQEQAPVHASGHAASGDMEELYKLVRPKQAIPVHGELRHQTAHERIAKSCGVKHTLIPANGELVRLAPGAAEIVGETPFGRLGLDGKILRSLSGDAVKNRRKIGYNGAVVISIVLDRREQLIADPQVSLLGLEDSANIEDLRTDLANTILDAVDKMTRATLSDDQAVKNALTQSARRLLNDSYGKRPVMEVNVMRV